MVRSPSHETHSLALDEALAHSGESGKRHSSASVSHSSPRQPLHPFQHALQMFTDASYEGWGAHLGDSMARGVWSKLESRLHINFLDLNAVYLALKSFKLLCRDQIVLIATDNTTVVSYINKKGSMRSGSLCALLWRLLTWSHPR